MFLILMLVGAVLVSITVVIHAIALDWLMNFMSRARNAVRLNFGKFWKAPMLVMAVLGVFVAHIVQIWIWALFYFSIHALPNFEDCLYFSTSTFTTVGFGDVVLSEKWRLVSSFQAANGFILFGWSTAFIYEIMSKLYENDSPLER